MGSICLEPIGFVKTEYQDDVVRSSIAGVKGYIEVMPRYREALKGLEGFSHIIVIAYLHKIGEGERLRLRFRPRKWAKLGIPEDEIPEVGVFSTDSPYRPNPIAISILKLIEIKDLKLYVDNLDLFDGTPVLDIKPYTFSRRIDSIRVPQWYAELLNKIRRRNQEVTEI